MRNYSYKIKLEVIYTEIADYSYLSHSISPYTCCGVNYGLNKIRHKTLACCTTRVAHVILSRRSTDRSSKHAEQVVAVML